jgi:tetratricopeptide (TPR) repeat protein
MADSALQQGEALAARGRWEDAQTQFERALRWNPGSAAAHYGLGAVRFGQVIPPGPAPRGAGAGHGPGEPEDALELGNLWRNTETASRRRPCIGGRSRCRPGRQPSA